MNGDSGGGVPAQGAQAAPVQPQIPVTDYAAFSPGQQGLLAQQMQQGYGGLLGDHMQSMGFYRDMRVPVINAPGDVPNYMQNVGLPITEGGTPANTAAYYAATQPGYTAPQASVAAASPAMSPAASPLMNTYRQMDMGMGDGSNELQRRYGSER